MNFNSFFIFNMHKSWKKYWWATLKKNSVLKFIKTYKQSEAKNAIRRSFFFRLIVSLASKNLATSNKLVSVSDTRRNFFKVARFLVI